MLMRNCAASKYVMTVGTLTTLMPHAERKLFDKILADGEFDVVQDFLMQHLPEWVPDFKLYQEDSELCAVFDDNDIYVKTPTEAGAKLKELTDYPEAIR